MEDSTRRLWAEVAACPPLPPATEYEFNTQTQNNNQRYRLIAAVLTFSVHLEEEGVVKELLLGQVLGVDDGLGRVQHQVDRVVLLLVVRVLETDFRDNSFFWTMRMIPTTMTTTMTKMST